MNFDGKPNAADRHNQDRLRNRISQLLAERLHPHAGNAEKFGNGRFIWGGAEYGDRGTKGDAVFYVSRDDVRGKRRRLRFEWRAYTAERVAEELLAAYEALGHAAS